MIPGRILHRLAARACSAKSLEHIVEPAIADLQKESADAAPNNLWRHGRILLTGYSAVLEVIAMSAMETSTITDDGRRALIRTLFWGLGATVCALGVLVVLTAAVLPGIPAYYLALMAAMMLPIAMPIGLTFGIAFGLGGRPISRSARNIVLLSAALIMVVSFGAMQWSMATASQSFRQSVSNTLGGRGTVTKGLHEISASEIQRDRNLAPAGDAMGWPKRRAWTYHLRTAMLFAAPVLALLALAVIGRGAGRAIVMGICAVYYILLIVGEALVYQGVPPIAAAWLPNLVFAGTAMFLLASRSPRAPSSAHSPA